MTQETATVEEALSVQSDGSRYVAYIVKWHGARVAVSDALSNTNYAVGDRINFPASRATSSSGRQLSFLLFKFGQICSAPAEAREVRIGASGLTYCPCGRDRNRRHSRVTLSIMSLMPGSTDALVRVSTMQKSRTHGCVRICS